MNIMKSNNNNKTDLRVLTHSIFYLQEMDKNGTYTDMLEEIKGDETSITESLEYCKSVLQEWAIEEEDKREFKNINEQIENISRCLQ